MAANITRVPEALLVTVPNVPIVTKGPMVTAMSRMGNLPIMARILGQRAQHQQLAVVCNRTSLLVVPHETTLLLVLSRTLLPPFLRKLGCWWTLDPASRGTPHHPTQSLSTEHILFYLKANLFEKCSESRSHKVIPASGHPHSLPV